MSTCSVDACSKAVKARGLCGTHYQRLRRTGDVNTVRKAGRPKDTVRQFWWSHMGNDFGSPRTMDRFLRAHRLAKLVGELRGEEHWGRDMLQRVAVRPNGSINVSRFLEQAEVCLYFELADTDCSPNGGESVEHDDDRSDCTPM